MHQVGQLFVLEGPDGVGKTELSKQLTVLLNDRVIPARHLSFPGREDATLGKLIYDLHHDPQSHGVARISPLSMQLLHIAAHLDSIESTILPALRAGISVVLDRFWWSTKVYGLASGVSKDALEQMIEIETAAWEGFLPTIIFLIRREEPLRHESKQEWDQWRELYADIALEETIAPVVIIDNDRSLQETTSLLISAIDAINRTRTTVEVQSANI